MIYLPKKDAFDQLEEKSPNRELARKILKALNNKGAQLGSAALFVIETQLDKHLTPAPADKE